jgi:3D (Asp-Asp-Asp) domain-containing protein
MTASGRSLGGLYGPWEATIDGGGTEGGVELTTRLALRFTTVEDGEGAVVGTFAFRGAGNVFPITSDLTTDAPVSGTARISGDKDHRRLCLKLRADQVSGRGRGSGPLSGGGEICIELPFSGGGSEVEEQFEIKSPKAKIALRENDLEGIRDRLPVIPAQSRVKGTDKVRYRQALEITVTQDGEPPVGVSLKLRSSRGKDDKLIPPTVKLDGSGKAKFELETWEGGARDIDIDHDEVSCEPLAVTLRHAWYETLFWVTGYNIPLESECHGKPIPIPGLPSDQKFRADWVAKTKMNGTGRALSGDYIIYIASTQEYVNNHDKRGGKKREVTDGSIAVDPGVIPLLHSVAIDGLGVCCPVDIGGGIHDYHIDVFLGEGQAVVNKYFADGGDRFRRVKYLGPGAPGEDRPSPDEPPAPTPPPGPPDSPRPPTSPDAPPGPPPTSPPGSSIDAGGQQRRLAEATRVLSDPARLPSFHIEVALDTPTWDADKRCYHRTSSSFAADVEGKRALVRFPPADELYVSDGMSHRLVNGKLQMTFDLRWQLWAVAVMFPLASAQMVAVFDRVETLAGRTAEVYLIDSAKHRAALAALAGLYSMFKAGCVTSIRGAMWVDRETGALVKADLDYVQAPPAEKGQHSSAPADPNTTETASASGHIAIAIDRIGSIHVAAPA